MSASKAKISAHKRFQMHALLMEGNSISEIAKKLGIPSSAVRSTLDAAKARERRIEGEYQKKLNALERRHKAEVEKLRLEIESVKVSARNEYDELYGEARRFVIATKERENAFLELRDFARQANEFLMVLQCYDPGYRLTQKDVQEIKQFTQRGRYATNRVQGY